MILIELLQLYLFESLGLWSFQLGSKKDRLEPSIRDRVHRNENFVEIIPVFSTFSNFFKKKKYIYKSHFM